MPQNQIKVFLSSTSKDLGLFRDAAADAIIQLEMHPIMMERFPAASRDAVDVCEAQVAEADVLIGIYANRYGYCPVNKDQSISDHSITEMEYRWAEAQGIDRLVFIFDADKAELPPDHPIKKYADHNPKMLSFLNHIGKQVVWKTFTSPDDLKHQVYLALEDWKNRPSYQKWFRSPRDVPKWARILSLTLLTITVGALAYSLWMLLRSGQEQIGLITSGVGLAITFVPVFTFFWKGGWGLLGFLPGINQLAPWASMLLFQILVVILVLILVPLTLGLAADNLLGKALVSSNIYEARIALNNAMALGKNVSVALDSELTKELSHASVSEDNTRSIYLSRLLVDYAPDLVKQNRSNEIEALLRQAAQEQSTARTQKMLAILAVLAPERTGQVARDLYSLALKLYAAQPPNFSLALSYLDSFIAVKDISNLPIASTEISYAYQLRGVILESRDMNSALDSYRDALNADDSNLEARYALASGLLIQVETGADAVLLNEAISVAKIGYENYISGNYCRGSQDLKISEVFRQTWHCFQLMTTEAGARFLRGSKEDTVSVIKGLLERAISLAEANDHFGAEHFTAEAYYWYTRTAKPDPSTKDGLSLYCDIIRYLDRTKPRHIDWLAYANEMLAGRFCLPN